MKRHLAVRRPVIFAACGLREPQRWTHQPDEVTCRGCQRTLAMADAEIKQSFPRESQPKGRA